MINTDAPAVARPTRVLVCEEWDDETRDVLVFEVETDDAGAARLRADEGAGTFRVLSDAPIV